MESLQKKIEADIRTAMKAKDSARLDTLRMFKSEMQYELTRTGAKELPDETVQDLLKKSAKKRKDSIEQFENAGRTELAEKEKAEMLILEEYLPAKVSEEAIDQILDRVFEAMKPAGPSDMGKVMGSVMKELKGQNFDGALVKTKVEARLKH